MRHKIGMFVKPNAFKFQGLWAVVVVAKEVESDGVVHLGIQCRRNGQYALCGVIEVDAIISIDTDQQAYR